MKLDEWVRTLLWENELSGEVAQGVEVLRCKGVWTAIDGRTFILQGVRSLYETREESATDVQQTTGKLVLIGRGLDDRVSKSLQQALKS